MVSYMALNVDENFSVKILALEEILQSHVICKSHLRTEDMSLGVKKPHTLSILLQPFFLTRDCAGNFPQGILSARDICLFQPYTNYTHNSETSNPLRIFFYYKTPFLKKSFN